MKTISIIRHADNPILKPNPKNDWEELAVFNPSVVKTNNIYHMLYRAMSLSQNISVIGYAKSTNGEDFTNRKLLIAPKYDWEKYGCEDPRITQIDDCHYIFYTALSSQPPTAGSIKVALAISEDLHTIKERYLITPFNAKAMALFPKKINGKYVAVLTVHTDLPPAKIALAYFDKLSDLWSATYWQNWYQSLEKHTLNVSRLNTDQVEVGGVPIETNEGWLFIYAHIQNYLSTTDKVFGIEALLLDKVQPDKIIGRTSIPLLQPQKDYELNGQVKNVIFPSGCLIENEKLFLYYGAADTYSCLATGNSKNLVKSLISNPVKEVFKLKKYSKNPILQPNPEQAWQSKAVFNPGVIYHQNTFYLIYRAFSSDNTSTFGCAMSKDGINFDHYSNEPIYVPRMSFEQKSKPNAFSGCEDPRITRINDKFYMFYTAFDGVHPPRVALTSISVKNFSKKQWVWSEPTLVSPDDVDNKNACVFPEKINGNYLVFHRSEGKEIAIDFTDNLNFGGNNLLQREGTIHLRPDMWDSKKIGIAGPPIKTPKGWLLIYHGVSRFDHQYRLGFMLLDLKNPSKVLYRSRYPILEPEESYEKLGQVENVVFSCGSVVVNNKLFVYYGGADRVICLATANINKLLSVPL